MVDVAEAETFDALPKGAAIGGYSIRRVIAKGGFGITYEAFNRVTGKTVAIKEFFPSSLVRRDGHSRLTHSKSDAEVIIWALRKFEETTTTLCGLDHPNIVRVHDYVPLNDTGYMIMELLDGRTLEGWLKARPGPPSLDELRIVMDPVMDALSYVHGRKLVHRDIAPDNILITRDGRPVLIDFGSVSRDLTDARAMTQAGGTKGVSKLNFTAPEQIQANAFPTPEADIYSLGAVFYFSVSGSKPTDGDRRKHDVFQGQADPYLPLSSRLPAGLAPRAAAAIDKALALRPGDRFHRIADLRSAFVKDDAPPRPPPPSPPEGAVRDPWTKWIAGVAVLAVLLCGLLGGKIWSDRQASAQNLRDQQERDRLAREQAERTQQQIGSAQQKLDESEQRLREEKGRTAAAQQRAQALAAQQQVQALAAQQQAQALAAQQQAQALAAQQQAQALAAQQQAQSTLQQRAAAAVSSFYSKHSYTTGDNLNALVSLYPAAGQIDVNGERRSGSQQVAALDQFFRSKRYQNFQIAPVPGSLTFDCDAADRCVVKGQTRATYTTEGDGNPRSSPASFCLRFDLRGSPKVLAEYSGKAGADLTCG